MPQYNHPTAEQRREILAEYGETTGRNTKEAEQERITGVPHSTDWQTESRKQGSCGNGPMTRVVGASPLYGNAYNNKHYYWVFIQIFSAKLFSIASKQPETVW